MGLAGRGTDAKLEQPGAQQVEPVPGTASPTPGRAGLAEAPCPRHPACTRLAPTAAHFPTVPSPLPPPPRSASKQCPGFLAQGKDAVSPSPLGAQALGVPHYQQPRSPQKSKHGIRPKRTPKCPLPPCRPPPVLGRLDTQTPWLPTAAPPGRWDRTSAGGARGSAAAPSSCLRLPGGGAAELGDCWLPPLLPELLLPATLLLSFHPTPGLHAAPSRPLPLQAGSPLCRHLL